MLNKHPSELDPPPPPPPQIMISVAIRSAIYIYYHVIN